MLFRDTVMENIRLGRRGATDEEVLEAAKAAQCDEFIRRLPQGYQDGDRGERLHPLRRGAAADLHRPGPVEGRAGGAAGAEATASLDVENESAVQTALSRLLRGKTVLVIAHRCAPWREPDHIVVLGGRPCGPSWAPRAELMDAGAASTAAWWNSRVRARPVAAERCGGITPFETGQKRARLNGAVPFCGIPPAGSRTCLAKTAANLL